jgi:hypothetical protein
VKIKNLFTGVISNERADIARALIRQGLCESLEPDAPRKTADTAPRFRVGETRTGYVALVMEILGRTEFYSGAPNLLNEKTFGGHMPPAEVLADYARAYSAPARQDPVTRDIQNALLTAEPGPHPENQKQARLLHEADQKLRNIAEEFVPTLDAVDVLGGDNSKAAAELAAAKQKPAVRAEITEYELERLSEGKPL